MNKEIVLDGKTYVLDEERYKKVEDICSPRAILGFKKLDDLSDQYSFLVKDYQRGYRWTKSEIDALLGDIDGIADDEDGYCMQPLVVKKHSNVSDEYSKLIYGDGESNKVNFSNERVTDYFELIDGQQRLTTIFLIKSFLGMTNESFTVFYELQRKLDAHYIRMAIESIKDWFKNKADYNRKCGKRGKPSGFEWKDENKDAFIQKLNKLFFIWYEIGDGSPTAEEIFRNINEGKIGLTNAELFKALLLNPDKQDAKLLNSVKQLQVIAFEWDKLESNLHDDDFWYFLSQCDVEITNQCTRLDYIIEMYARLLNNKKEYKFDQNKDYFSFLVIQRYLQEDDSGKGVYGIWREIVSVYDRLYSWYKDFELYHTIGFIVASEEKRFGSKSVVPNRLFSLYEHVDKEEVSLCDTRACARSIIYDLIIEPTKSKKYFCTEDLSYDDRDVIKNVLLFSNIFALFFNNSSEHNDGVIDSCIRFPFRLYHHIGNGGKGWDIEHISPRVLEKDISSLDKEDNGLYESTIVSWLNELEDINENRDYINCINDYLESPSDDNKRSINEKWRKYAEDVSQDPDDNIKNLVLLNTSINREYHNAFFNVKRQIIIDKDRNGIFIPICTKNVFMKYYSKDVCNLTRWTSDDKGAYGDFLDEMLKEIKGWKKK